MNHKCSKCGEETECEFNAWIDTSNMCTTVGCCNPAHQNITIKTTKEADG